MLVLSYLDLSQTVLTVSVHTVTVWTVTVHNGDNLCQVYMKSRTVYVVVLFVEQ